MNTDDATSKSSATPHSMETDDNELSIGDLIAPLKAHWKLLIGTAIVTGSIGAASSFLISPKFLSTTTFLPPQQQQSSAAAAMASLGALAGIAGNVAGIKSPADQYVSLMQSVTVSDRLIDRFKLMDAYHAKYRKDARQGLAKNVDISIGKKDGLISVAVSDVDPIRAAAIANRYVDELRTMTSVLAISEAQQRRVFFEKQMLETQSRLIAAQTALQESGVNASTIKTEPRAAAEQYANLRAQLTAAQIRLQTLRTSLAEGSPEVRQQVTSEQAIQSQLDSLAQNAGGDSGGPNYINKYRDFKYQETLFDLMSKQYELARVDESREGALIQVVDPAQPAEVKSSPKRSMFVLAFGLGATLLLALGLIIIHGRRRATRVTV